MDILQAIRNNNITRVKELLDSGVIDSYLLNYSLNYSLDIAFLENKIEIAKLLLSRHDINVNLQDKEGQTPLYRACYYGRTEVVQLLLEQPNINVNIQNTYGETPLYIACCYGHTEVIKLLLSHPKIDVNLQGINGKTLLYRACIDGNIKIVKLLIQHPKIKIDFNILKFKNNVKLYSSLKGRKDIILSKVTKILDMIES